MRRNARGSDLAVQGLGQPVDELGALTRREDAGRAGGQDEVAVEVDDERVRRSREQRAAFG